MFLSVCLCGGSTHGFLQLALDSLSPHLKDGLVLEFGVYFGKTLRMIAERLPEATVVGFDTFTGLPEDWHFEGRGSCEICTAHRIHPLFEPSFRNALLISHAFTDSAGGLLPPAPSNVLYEVGTFAETLPGFLERTSGPVRFVNVDCDLYSSTKSIFDELGDRIVVGTVIVFDEYVMTSRWQEDEFKAFHEEVAKRGWEYDYIGISLVSGQAAVRITAVHNS